MSNSGAKSNKKESWEGVGKKNMAVKNIDECYNKSA